MTNNTIQNVPRELLAELQEHIDCHRDAVLWGKVCDLLSAPSPAVVDGLDVVGTIATMGFGRHCISADFTACDKLKVGDSVTAMLPTQAIIAGLRGEVERSQRFAAGHVLTNERISANLHAVESERDQQAQRIGELEGLLRHAQKQVPTGSGLHMRIDAALAAVCAAAPNIAPTSEHSGS